MDQQGLIWGSLPGKLFAEGQIWPDAGGVGAGPVDRTESGLVNAGGLEACGYGDCGDDEKRDQSRRNCRPYRDREEGEKLVGSD